MAKVNVLALQETNRQLLAQCKQALEANDKVALQALMTTIGTNNTTMNNAISAETNVNRLQGLE